MKMDLWVGFFKIISMLATGAFGCIALLKKFKTDEGLTKWGKFALGGIVLSSILSLTLYVLETSGAKAKAQQARLQAEATTHRLEGIIHQTNVLKSGLETNLETTKVVSNDLKESVNTQQILMYQSKQISSGVTSSLEKQVRTLLTTQHVAQQSENALTQLGRLQYPLNNIGTQVFIKVSPDHPLIAPHLPEIKANAQVAADIFRSQSPMEVSNLGDPNDQMGYVYGRDGNAKEAQLMRNRNAILPLDAELIRLLAETHLTFQFFKHNPTDTEIKDQKGDLFYSYTSYSFDAGPTGNQNSVGQLRYSFADQSFSVFGTEVRPIKFAATSKDMFSVLDFQGATLVVSAPYPRVIDEGYSIAEMVITTPLDQRIIISKFDRRWVGNQQVLVYNFPKKLEELFAGSSRFLN